jgi:PAS domain S-box-containing protein
MTDDQTIRQLFDDYLRMYASRDDQLTTHFSDDFSGFTGGGDFLVKDRQQWVAITRQDFAQIKEPIRIELKDLAIQSLADTIAVATGFFTIHLPIKDHILSRETARLVLIFRKESHDWKISHSSISIPYHLVREGEVYPLMELVERNRALEQLVAERTDQLSRANEELQRTNQELARKVAAYCETQAALQASEERYRSILHASPDDITITDREGRILMVSPMALTLWHGERIDEYLGRPLTDFLVPEDRGRALSQIAQKLKGIMTGPTEYRGLRRDGSVFDIEVNSEFIRNAEGSPTGMVVIVRDITERKHAQLEREKLEAQNRQLQKAESLGRMAGAIAHHFNNQLQAVMLSLDWAMNDLVASEGPGRDVSEAMQSARNAADLSRLMLTYLGQTISKPEPLDVSKVCHDSLTLLRAVMPQAVSLESELPSPGPAIRADANQIQHVLTNLVTNAWEATGDAEGVVRLTVTTVSAAEIAATHRFPIDCQPSEPSYACMEVVDTGCGIQNEDIEKIFDPFFSSKFPGRGMGLAVAIGIIRSHKGAITVKSEPGRGSVFRVYLPAC